MSNFFAKMNATKPVKEREEFIYLGNGNHKLVCLLVEPYVSKTRGDSIRAVFEVLESDAYQPGTRVSKAWETSGFSKFPGGETDLDRFAYFVRRMMGADDTYPAIQEAMAVGQDRVAEQLFRGMVIEATGTTKVSSSGKPWTTIYWKSVKQTGQEIAGRRADLDQRHPLKATPAPAQTAFSYTQPVTHQAAAQSTTASTTGFLSQIPGFNK